MNLDNMDLSKCLEIITPKGTKLTAKSQIGAGTYGYVLKVHDENGVASAIKVVPTSVKDTDIVNYEEKLATREMSFHQFNASTNHPFLVQTFEVWQISKRLQKEYVSWRKLQMKALGIKEFDYATSLIRMNRHEDVLVNLSFFHIKYYPNGSLDSWLHKSARNFQNTYSQRAKFSRDIVTGVDYLHSKGFMHRDLCPTNILLDHAADENVKAVISDFGTIISRGSNAELQLTKLRQKHTQGVRTDVYAAPEVFASTYEKTCDLYSIGVILLRMHFNLESEGYLQDAVLAIERNDDLNAYHWEFPCQHEFWLGIIRKQLSRGPGLRIGCMELLQLLDKENIVYFPSIKNMSQQTTDPNIKQPFNLTDSDNIERQTDAVTEPTHLHVKNELMDCEAVSLVKTSTNTIVMVVGTPGTGKSTIINMLYNNDFTKEACQKPCSVGFTADSVTKEQVWQTSPDGKTYGDTIGFSNPDLTDLEIAQRLRHFINMFAFGVHCIIIVIKFDRVSKEEHCNLKVISKISDAHWVDSCIMVLTHYEGDTNEEAQQADIEQWLGSDQEMNNFISKIGKRIVLTNNSVAPTYEAICRPLRKQCLTKLNAFINTCDLLISSNLVLDHIRNELKQLLDFYRTRDAAKRLQVIIEYLRSQ